MRALFAWLCNVIITPIGRNSIKNITAKNEIDSSNGSSDGEVEFTMNARANSKAKIVEKQIPAICKPKRDLLEIEGRCITTHDVAEKQYTNICNL